MPKLRTTVATGESEEIERNTTIVTDKLRGKGVPVLAGDTADDIVNILETVEAFEDAVRLAGGDLMMDEPPAGSEPQPDDERFVLPTRQSNEHASLYIERVIEATRVARGEVAPE
jgi:hypothetical protein